ncbi:MAG: hypothetical protein OIF56_04335 [Cohaesibacter sp.]|nr:hypothetical protein [Cohaesibacter sp.]MCV6601613.1 hypothetical protein [Cohaesibacter sp.]
MSDFYGAFEEMVGLCFYEPKFFDSHKEVSLESDKDDTVSDAHRPISDD